jgi:hypothetical protein
MDKLALIPLYVTQCNATSSSLWPNASLVLFTSPRPASKDFLPEMRYWLSTATDDLHALGVQPVVSTCCPTDMQCKVPSMALFNEDGESMRVWPNPAQSLNRRGPEKLFSDVHTLLEDSQGILRGDFSMYQSHYVASYLESDRFLIGLFPTGDLLRNILEFKAWRKKRELEHPEAPLKYFYFLEGHTNSFLQILFDVPLGPDIRRYFYIDKSRGVRLVFKSLEDVKGI